MSAARCVTNDTLASSFIHSTIYQPFHIRFHNEKYRLWYLYTQISEVNGCNEICIVLEATIDTPEEGLSPAVVFIYGPASRTALRCEVRPHQDHWNPQVRAFVAEHLQKPGDGPGLEKDLYGSRRSCPLNKS